MKNIAIITGASSGIGLETAKLFLKQNYEVINLSRSPCPEPQVKNIFLDLEHIETVKIVEQIMPFLQKANLICLIHNAALTLKDAVPTLEIKNLQKLLQINVVACEILNQMIIPHMKKGSSILYVGSTLSTKAIAGSASYTISKHALVGLMRATCQDLQNSFIHTACICPGPTRTPMLIDTIIANDPKILKHMESLSVENRLIEPIEIARTLFFCAENSVINGSIIHAHLGQKES